MSLVTKATFQDFVDVQSRLVLLPCVEEEGCGAVVASYIPHTKEQAEVVAKEDPPRGEEASKDSDGAPVEDGTERVGDGLDCEESVISVNLDDEEEEEKKSEDEEDTTPAMVAEQSMSVDVKDDDHDHDTPLAEELVGKVLVAINGMEVPENAWIRMDLTDIIASIRDAPTPIVLSFQKRELTEDGQVVNGDEEQIVDIGEEEQVDDEEEHADDNDDDTQESALDQPDDADAEEAPSPEAPTQKQESDSATPSSFSRWSSWGSRFADAASSAKSYASAVAVAAAEAKERAQANKAANAKPEVSKENLPGLFIQTPAGDFVSVENPKVNVTTTSVVMFRKSYSQACPSKGYQFVWYRSYRPHEGSKSDNRSLSSSTRSGSGETSVASLLQDEVTWEKLEGANYAAYQPSATDIGHRLRCAVFEQREDADDDSQHESSNDDVFHGATPLPVAADSSLFNCARQALLRGATFSGLVGTGNAEGRTFRLLIEITRCPEDKSVSSSARVFQLDGSTAEPMHPEPILRASAIADPANPKGFCLVFPSGLPESAQMMSALSTDGRFSLLAPNRLTRETLLLALGIANFQGKPADLDLTTDLFPGSILCGPPAVGDQLFETPVKSVIRDVEFFTPVEEPVRARLPSEASADSDRIRELELELRRLHTKMTRKDKTVTDLQRQLSRADARREKTEKALRSSEEALGKTRSNVKELKSSVRIGEKRAQTLEDTIHRMKSDQLQHRKTLSAEIDGQTRTIASLEKSVRTLQNEKAVLSAAVEARDGKLSKMSELQSCLDALSEKVAKNEGLRNQLSDMNTRYEDMCTDLQKIATSEKDCKEQLEQTKSNVEELCAKLEREEKRKKQCQAELDNIQNVSQTLRAERNSYKQKVESLQKEISRLCRGGRTLKDIEMILADNEARKTEVRVLKEQKRKALAEVEQYRAAYEKQLVAQLKLGVDGAALKALEQKAELERVVSDLTEYVNAKEMQIETMKQVNTALSDELRALAKATMKSDEI